MRSWLLPRRANPLCHEEAVLSTRLVQRRPLSQTACARTRAQDPRVRDIGRKIKDDYAYIRDHYGTIYQAGPPVLPISRS